MGVIQLIVLLVVIAVIVWAVTYLLGSYMNPTIRDLIVKIAMVACVILVLFWILSLFGLAPAPNLQWK